MAEEEALGSEYKYGLDNDDIVPKIYEGGFKTWECSKDLANLMAEDDDHDPLRGALNAQLDPRDCKIHVVEVSGLLISATSKKVAPCPALWISNVM